MIIGCHIWLPAPGRRLSGHVWGGTIDGSSQETKKTTALDWSNNSGKDAIDHSQDMFVIWTNPQLTYSDDGYDLTQALGSTPR